MMLSRRAFAAGAVLAAGATSFRLSKAQARAIAEPERFTGSMTREPLTAGELKGRTAFVTLNGGSLPLRVRDGVKEFHLVAEPVERELAPGSVAHLWGYNGSSPSRTA